MAMSLSDGGLQDAFISGTSGTTNESKGRVSGRGNVIRTRTTVERWMNFRRKDEFSFSLAQPASHNSNATGNQQSVAGIAGKDIYGAAEEPERVGDLIKTIWQSPPPFQEHALLVCSWKPATSHSSGEHVSCFPADPMSLGICGMLKYLHRIKLILKLLRLLFDLCYSCEIEKNVSSNGLKAGMGCLQMNTFIYIFIEINGEFISSN